eukprot:gene16671-biopygen12828
MCTADWWVMLARGGGGGHGGGGAWSGRPTWHVRTHLAFGMWALGGQAQRLLLCALARLARPCRPGRAYRAKNSHKHLANCRKIDGLLLQMDGWPQTGMCRCKCDVCCRRRPGVEVGTVCAGPAGPAPPARPAWPGRPDRPGPRDAPPPRVHLLSAHGPRGPDDGELQTLFLRRQNVAANPTLMLQIGGCLAGGLFCAVLFADTRVGLLGASRSPRTPNQKAAPAHTPSPAQLHNTDR